MGAEEPPEHYCTHIMWGQHLSDSSRLGRVCPGRGGGSEEWMQAQETAADAGLVTVGRPSTGRGSSPAAMPS